MNKELTEAIYHCCRVAFCLGEDEYPWHMVLHALRQGLDLRDTVTYTLQDKDFEQYPELRDMIKKLERARQVSTAGQSGTP